MSATPAMSADRVLSTQVLFSLTIVDAITQRAIERGRIVSLRRAGEDQEVPGLRRRNVEGRASVVWYGDPRHVLARLATEQFDLELVASVAGYVDGALSLSLDAADGSLKEVTLASKYGDVIVEEWKWIDGLDPHPLRLELHLQPQLISLRGQVRQAHSPFTPIPGATVAITAPGPNPPVTTDAAGVYTFATLPRVPSIAVAVSRAGFRTVTRSVSLDYGQPLNVVDFVMIDVQ